jgi:hypothetical protein
MHTRRQLDRSSVPVFIRRALLPVQRINLHIFSAARYSSHVVCHFAACLMCFHINELLQATLGANTTTQCSKEIVVENYQIYF